MADLTDKDRWELQRLMEKDPKAAFAFYERKLAEPTVQPPLELPPPKPYLPLTLNLPFGGWPLPKEADVVMLSARDPVLRDGKSPFVIARHGETPLNGEHPDDRRPVVLLDGVEVFRSGKAYGSCAAASLEMILDVLGRDESPARYILMVGDGPVPEGFVPIAIGGDGTQRPHAAFMERQERDTR